MDSAATRPPRLLDRIRQQARLRHLSFRTEEAYVQWVRRFVVFHGRRHPRELGAVEIAAFLTHLAVDRHVTASTQGQALSALVFLYRQVLGLDVPDLDALVRARRPQRLPVVLTPEEVHALLEQLRGTPRLVASLLYGSGLRLLEALRLRVKDVDFSRRQILVRSGKGDRDRAVPLPERLAPELRAHLDGVRRLHERDRAAGRGEVWLPHALAHKLPRAAGEWPWQWLFPSSRLSRDPGSGRLRRHHLHETAVQRAVRAAGLRRDLAKRATNHGFRHNFATPLHEAGYDLPTVQTLLGHRSVATTMIYTHVLRRGALAVRSPLDAGPQGGRGAHTS